MQLILAMLLLPSATLTGDAGLCARIGTQSLPPAIVSRNVRYQLCASGGYPIAAEVSLELATDSGTSRIVTGQDGRFTLVYGDTGPARELQVFRFDGRVIAVFVVERGPDRVEVRRKNLQDPEVGEAYP